MKILQWYIVTALIIFCNPSWAIDSTGIELANSLNKQMQINRQNSLQGAPDKNRYVLNVDFEKNQANEPVSKKFNNGGEAFWKGMDETLINQKILAAKESFGDLGYYVVVASIFKYADIDFDADQQQDWQAIKDKQKDKGTTISSSDHSKNYFSKLIGYVNKTLNVPQNGKYLINYYFTVFTYDATTNQYLISYKSYVAYSAASNLAGKAFPAFNNDLINDFKADKSKWISKNIESDAAVIAQINKNKLNTPGNGNNGNDYVIDYSKDGTGHSSFSQYQLATLGKNMTHVEKAFGEKIKVYILNTCNIDYDKNKAQSAADPAANKIVITEDCDHHNIKMEHSFKVPQWVIDVLPDYTGTCTDDYINIGLDALHKTGGYINEGNADQTIDEIETITYRSMFGSLYCATSEESVQHANSTEQYVAGALHEVIATVDVDELIKGLLKMGEAIVSSNTESYEGFYNDVRQTFKDIKNGTPLTNQQLVQRLIPPAIRNEVKLVTTSITIGKQFTNFYFTGCDNYTFKNGTVGPICPYRYGQVTVMIVPIILTGGEWAFARATKMSAELGILVQKVTLLKVSEQTTADFIILLKEAEQTGKTVIQDVDKIVIKQGDNLVATIEKNGGEVKVAKGEGGVKNWIAQRNSFWDEWINKCFPNKNWSTTTFKIVGKDYDIFKTSNSNIDNEMRSMYNTAADADKFLPGVINSGSTNPVKLKANKGDKFYKIISKGGNINSPSPYYLSEAEYNWIKANPTELEQKLGLPLSSVSGEYDVFTITSKTNNNKLFQSTVAPTKQYANSTPNIIYSTSGSKTQALIINNADEDFWLKSISPVETLIPYSLPHIIK